MFKPVGLATQEVEIRRINGLKLVQAKSLQDPISTKDTLIIPAIQGSIKRRIIDQAIKQESISKITNEKKGW
jgi:hypothetical protein